MTNIKFEKSSPGMYFFESPKAWGFIKKHGQAWFIHSDQKALDGSTIKAADCGYGWTLKEAKQKTTQMFG